MTSEKRDEGKTYRIGAAPGTANRIPWVLTITPPAHATGVAYAVIVFRTEENGKLGLRGGVSYIPETGAALERVGEVARDAIEYHRAYFNRGTPS